MVSSSPRVTRRWVEAKTDFGTINIEVYITSDKKLLTQSEHRAIEDSLCDDAMKALTNAPYAHIVLNRLKVR